MGNEEVDLISHSREKKQTLLEKFDIPIDHLSYEYIGECKNAKELERVVRILRSGEEGSFPHLTGFAEDRLRQVKPESTILRVARPVLPRSMLAPSERRELDGDLDDWLREMRTRERDLGDEKVAEGSEQALPQPAVRIVASAGEPSTTLSQSKAKRLTSSDYAGWDKYDADTELSRIELDDERRKVEAKRHQEQRKAELAKTRKETIIEKSLLTGTELSVLAVREREKGNEAFRAGDYAEALQLYGASIALDCDILAYNNRAMTHIKLKNYDKAITDCNSVLNVDCSNVKALLRRALAFDHLDKSNEALRDYEAVLRIDPTNSLAISAVNRLRRDEDAKTVRLTIEEIHDE